jgi:hypothetical protein
MAYNYDSLNLSTSEIRLLTLEPARFDDDPILCQLRTFSLSENPRYEALPYVWGNPEQWRTISVNGHAFTATFNLDVTLRHLRHALDPRILWVDAICINQFNKKEKSHQVQLMHHIYASASQVLVWLGESDVDIDRAIDFLLSLGAGDGVYNGDREAKNGENKKSSPFPRDSTEVVPFIPGLEKLFKKPW